VVGRLVEQQHVRVLRQRATDGGAAALAARCGVGGAIEVEPDLLGDRLHLVHGRGVGRSQRIIAQRRAAFHARLLLQQDHPRTGLDGAAALVRIDGTGDQLEQGGLARAVAADQRQPVARADMDVQMPEQPAGALNDTEILIGKDGSSHKGAARRCAAKM
jgi:hypothetical protein